MLQTLLIAGRLIYIYIYPMIYFVSGELKFNHLKRPYFVSMGTFHMAILLLFNSSDSLKLSDIMEHTKLSEAELKKQLQTLTETKIVVLEVSHIKNKNLNKKLIQ